MLLFDPNGDGDLCGSGLIWSYADYLGEKRAWRRGGQREFFVHESGVLDRAGYSAAGGFADYPGWDHASDDSGMQETDLIFLVGILRLPFFLLRGD